MMSSRASETVSRRRSSYSCWFALRVVAKVDGDHGVLPAVLVEVCLKGGRVNGVVLGPRVLTGVQACDD